MSRLRATITPDQYIKYPKKGYLAFSQMPFFNLIDDYAGAWQRQTQGF